MTVDTPMTATSPFILRRSAAVLTLAFTVLLVGCTTDTGPLPALAFSDDGAYLPHQLASGLVADEQSPIPDLPKPLRFVPVPSRSSASFDGTARTVTHVYQGRSNLEDLDAFYRAAAVNHGWRPDPSNTAQSPILTYVKGPESLQIALNRAGGVSTVTVLIRPR